MANIDQITESILEKIDSEGFKQEGAYNLRYNGYSLCHGNTEHITIKRKEDKQGIDVYIDKDASPWLRIINHTMFEEHGD